MICNDTKSKVEKLKAKGFQENIDFRVVYFSDKTEVQMVRK